MAHGHRGKRRRADRPRRRRPEGKERVRPNLTANSFESIVRDAWRDYLYSRTGEKVIGAMSEKSFVDLLKHRLQGLPIEFAEVSVARDSGHDLVVEQVAHDGSRERVVLNVKHLVFA